MAEFIFKAMAAEKGVTAAYGVASAAVSDEEIGNGIYPPARACLSRHGIPFDKHRTARRMTRADYDAYDLVVVMDEMNVRWIRRIIGEDDKQKVVKMMSFAGKNRDVADPWYTGDFEQTYRDLCEACGAMLQQI